jgi:alpha-glucosidase
MMMSHATYAGLKHISNKRPFVLTRSTFSGGQEYAAVWTGDNVASWEHLKIANYQCQNLAISGFSFTGSDIGGFVGNPDGELFCRWLQLAVFHPFFRTHSSKDFDAQEPWSFGEKWTDIARSIIE